jgi:orotate phosphoribosyltransferase
MEELNGRMRMNDKKLGDKLQECGAVKFGDFTLASGKKSRYYVDIKKAVTKPEILELICEHVTNVIVDRNIQTDYIAAVELGAVPIGVMVSVLTGLPLLIIRKAQKDHGLKSRIVGDLEKTKTALFVEDVTTTGGSIIGAVKVLRDEGLIVETVISVVDREEGAEIALAEEGLTLISLVKAKTLLEDYEIAEALRYSGVIMNNEVLTGNNI